ncbi:MAG: MBL fold metallo-hydrolase [Polyangiaceae bacterium]
MARAYAGKEILPVYCYAVGDTLVDTGIACEGRALVVLAKRLGIRRAILTHHHEDHAGNARELALAGVAIEAAARTSAILERGVPIRFYQHVLWGNAPPAKSSVLSSHSLRIGSYAAEAIPADGHCADQVAFFVPSEGWLFSGDAFIHERIKVFRRDEDFAAMVATLRRFLALDFDTLLCAHGPRLTNGRAAVAAKLEWLLGIEARVRELHRRGCTDSEIANRLEIPRPAAFQRVTFGDVSTCNIVRSVLYGPAIREELAVDAQLK